MSNLAKMRTLLLIGILLGHSALGQLPVTLLTDRSIVVMDWPLKPSGDFMVRGDWEKAAKDIQKSLGLIGIDAIAYVHTQDWHASRESNSLFREFFSKRQVKHVLVVGQRDGLFEVAIQPISANNTVWHTNGGSLSQLMYRLGRETQTVGLTRENFLPVDVPEIVTDVPFSNWSASLNFPDAIKRLKIGVAKSTNEADNVRLIQLLAQYPFEYDLIDYTTDEDAFRKGYQFVLVSMTTSGESIKKLLNYKVTAGETHYMSTTSVDERIRLKAIPIDALVTKYYFRNTVNHEAYVGVDWDADVTWEQSLTNFLRNLRIAFRLS